MYRNYILTAWRNLLRNKFYTAINITGLAIGLSVSIMILLWVQDELSYDDFHKNARNIYKVNSHMGTGSVTQVWEGAPSPIAYQGKKQIPEIENALRILDRFDNLLYTYKDKRITGSEMAYVDPSLFTMFDFRLIKGNNKNPFPDSHSIVLSATVAKNFFGNEDPIGKILIEDGKDNYKVTGVVEDFPQNSSLKFGMMFPMQLFADRFGGNLGWKTIDEDLGNFYYRVFLQLKPGASPAVTETKINSMYTRLRGEDPNSASFDLQPLQKLHLYGTDGNARAMQNVRTFLIVAVLILVIACINYVNLSTARSIIRSKEVSVRKVMGAERNQLFMQFVCETTLLFLFGALISLLIIWLLLPLYNQISGKQLVFDLSNRSVWLVLLAAVTGSLVIASIYPALLLSSFKPVAALKGKLSRNVGNAGFRKVLVITQFVFSVALIISTIVMGMQMTYVKQKNLGYDKEHIFSFNIRQEFFDHFDAARAELSKVPGVISVSSSAGNIIGKNGSTSDTDWDGKEEGRMFVVNTNGVDERFIPMFNMQLAAGKNFTGSKSDSAHILLNETAVREAGIKEPVGKRFTLWQTNATIIGVIKDYNYESLKEKIQPVVLFYQPAGYRVFVKTTGADAAKVLAAAERVWNHYSPGYAFNYSFVDEDYDALYQSEQRTSILFNVFAIIAILISCLGLFGLSTYTAQVKRKEVGIRKVLGASVSNITGLLARDFISLVFISLLIAIPVAGWAMHAWLQNYVYRIDMSWWIFVIAGMAAILIAFVTVSYQAVRAAMANPTESLKEE